MEKVIILNRGGADILEKLNRKPLQYMRPTYLLSNQPKSNFLLLTTKIIELERIGYVESRNNGAGIKITETGQKALMIYRGMKHLIDSMP